MATITINGNSVEVPPNLTVLEAAKHAGVEIPTLCYHKDLSPLGGCRLCIVEVKGARLPMTSCTLPVTEGMDIVTGIRKINRIQANSTGTTPLCVLRFQSNNR